MGQFAESLSLLRVYRADFPQSGSLNRALLWQGKAAIALGQGDVAREAWALAARDPKSGYYALRARDLLGQLGSQTAPILAVDERPVDLWLRAWAPGDPEAGRQAVMEDPALQRIQGLMEVRLVREATGEAVALRQRIGNNPWALLAYVGAMRDVDLTNLAVPAATRLLALGEAAGAPPTPRGLWALAYPVDYGDLIRQEATRRGLDPLWLFALIRQESAFGRFALSVAEARGLGQIIPSTARAIAGQLGVSNFLLEDLYTPRLSISFAAYYLGEQVRAANGNIFVALAAYNGGLRNALRWRDEAGPGFDLDVFVETIDFPETQEYIRQVYQHYARYRALVGP
jgi:soluble lytic murein transglycosylase